MEQLVTGITSFITWLQIPAVVCYALALLFGGYEMLLCDTFLTEKVRR